MEFCMTGSIQDLVDLLLEMSWPYAKLDLHMRMVCGVVMCRAMGAVLEDHGLELAEGHGLREREGVDAGWDRATALSEVAPRWRGAVSPGAAL